MYRNDPELVQAGIQPIFQVSPPESSRIRSGHINAQPSPSSDVLHNSPNRTRLSANPSKTTSNVVDSVGVDRALNVVKPLLSMFLYFFHFYFMNLLFYCFLFFVCFVFSLSTFGVLSFRHR